MEQCDRQRLLNEAHVAVVSDRTNNEGINLMTHANRLERFQLSLAIDSTHVDIAGMYRPGTGDPLVFLHGFGSTKEDYADVIQQARLLGRPVLAYDAPGCGQTTCSDLSALAIPFLVTVATEVLRARQVDRFHLIGHSMGGLTALWLAEQYPSRIVSFVNIEGNLAPEDCFFSRQVITHAHPEPHEFLDEFADRMWRSRYAASALFAASLPHKVRAGAVKPIFESMVHLSDHGDLMRRFLALPMPTMFMYGEQNNLLSYLATLAGNGVELAEIPHSAHFPMYSNAPEMWARITDFVLQNHQ
jgi:pimeloyl-ACP methyl ester carboxylesterase